MRIPTYSFQESQRHKGSLQVFSPGSSAEEVFPNLVFVRDKEYRFYFLPPCPGVEFFDKAGRILFKQEKSEKFLIIPFKFKSTYPNEIYYRIPNSDDKNKFGKILIRDFGNVTGKVISYGYASNSKVYDSELNVDLTTSAPSDTDDTGGTYELNLNNLIKSSSDTYFVNFDLFTIDGYDTAVLNPHGESYKDNLKFRFYAKPGCLNISSMSSVFYFICKKLVTLNYREIENKMKKYFSFSNDFDPITDDPIYCYMTSKISLDDLKKYILFTTIVELHFAINEQQKDTAKLNYVYTKIANNILDGNTKFDYDIMQNIMHYDKDNIEESRLVNRFESLYGIITERIMSLSDKHTKKVCVMESIYSILYKFRTAVYFPKLVSTEQFLMDGLDTIPNTVKIPKQKFTLLLASVPGCSVAPFGRYAKLKITENLLFNIFNQVLPIEPEVTENLINKTLYIRYNKKSNYDYYCYKVIDFVDFDYKLYNINESNETEDKSYTKVIQGFTESMSCCELESAVKTTQQEINKKLEITEEEKELYIVKMFDLDKKSTEEIAITNRNYPSRLVENTSNEIFYIDEFLERTSYRVLIPAYICIQNEFSSEISDTNGITLTFDSKNRIYNPEHIRYDFETIKVTNSVYENDELTITTDAEHGFNVGDTIIIKNSSKDKLIDGSYVIIGDPGEHELVLDYDLPANKSAEDVTGSYGELETLNTTKVYTDVTEFNRGDFIFFEKAVDNIPHKVLNIKRDYLGTYLVVEGNIPRNVGSFVKVNSSDQRTFKEDVPRSKYLHYSLHPKPERLNIPTIDFNLYKIYTPTKSGQLSKYLTSKLISSIKITKKPIELLELEKLEQANSTETSEPSKIESINVQEEVVEVKLDMSEETKDDTLNKVIYSDTEVAYHYTRPYLKNEYDLADYDKVSPDTDTFDWNNDGIVGIDELKILERFLLTSPETVEEYNENRGDAPMTNILPTVITATYACQEYCCHDDFTESEDFTMEDVYVYDAFQTYMDSIGIKESEYEQFKAYYDSLVAQGIAEVMEQEIVYMPTAPSEHKYCGDYTNSGHISPDDSHIYFAHQLYVASHNNQKPSTVAEFQTYYNKLVSEGIVPKLLNSIEKLPSMAVDDAITIPSGELKKDCELITGKDLAIFNEWILQGKPEDLDTFNKNRSASCPRACFLPAKGDGYDPGDYEMVGLGYYDEDGNEVEIREYTGLDIIKDSRRIPRGTEFDRDAIPKASFYGDAYGGEENL